MPRKVIDTSIKFDKNKHYCIAKLQNGKEYNEVPEGFSNKPKPLYFSGTDLINGGIKSCRDFLVQRKVYFEVGSPVSFYEIDSAEGSPSYNYLFTGTMMQPPPEPQIQTQLQPMFLSDGKDLNHTINNIIPNAPTSEYEKMFFKNQTEQIAYYQKCLQDERKQFDIERVNFGKKIDELNDKILNLNIEKNSLEAENTALKIKYEEASKFADRMQNILKESEVKEEEVPQGLADKTVAMLDGVLGDGASQQIVMGLAQGVGSGISKLIDFGVDYFKQKNSPHSVQQIQPQAQVDASSMMAPDPLLLQQLQEQQNREKFNKELAQQWQLQN